MTNIVLLSGGIDSSVLLASTPKPVHALTFDYGQQHRLEIESARRLAATVPHTIVSLDLTALATPLVGGSAPVGVPSYVPARNTVFLAYAIGLAESIGADRIRIGANRDDYDDYPDCRPEYFAAAQRLVPLATHGHPTVIDAPFVNMTKTDIIRLGVYLGVDFAKTTSCYDPASEGACGLCDACVLRRRSFKAADVDDLAVYR